MAPILRFSAIRIEPLCEYAYGVMLQQPRIGGKSVHRGGAARASLLLLDKDKIRVEDIL